MKTFTATLAYNICAYKTVEVDARSHREAIEKIRAAIENPAQSLWDNLTPESGTEFEHRISYIENDIGVSYFCIPLYPDCDGVNVREDRIVDADELAARLDRLGIIDTTIETITTTEEMAVTIRNGLDGLLDAEISEDFSNLFVSLPDGQKFFIKVERIDE